MKCLYTAQKCCLSRQLTRFWDTVPETLVYNCLRHLFISAAPVLLTAHRKKLSERAHSNYSIFQSSMKNDKLEGQDKTNWEWKHWCRGVQDGIWGGLYSWHSTEEHSSASGEQKHAHTHSAHKQWRGRWETQQRHIRTPYPLTHAERAADFNVKRPLSPGIWQRQMLRMGSHTHAGLRWEQMGEGSPHTGTHPFVSKGERRHWSATWRSFYPHTHTQQTDAHIKGQMALNRWTSKKIFFQKTYHVSEQTAVWKADKSVCVSLHTD